MTTKVSTTTRNQLKRWHVGAVAAGLGALIVVCTCIGVIAGSRIASSSIAESATRVRLPLHAGSAAKGKSISMATGLIDGEVEGLYLLDHASGNLQCWILNARTGAVGGVYRANVLQDLQSDNTGESDFVMTTGNFFWGGGVIRAVCSPPIRLSTSPTTPPEMLLGICCPTIKLASDEAWSSRGSCNWFAKVQHAAEPERPETSRPKIGTKKT